MTKPEEFAAQSDIAALAVAEQRYRALVRATSSLVWVTAADGQIVDMPEWRAYTGESVEQIKGWGWLNSLHPDDRERTAVAWQRAVDARSFYETDYRIRRNDGVYVWHQARGVPVLEADGSIREWVGICLDITQRRQAEEKRIEAETALRRLNETLEQRVQAETQALRESEYKLRQILETVPGLIWLTKPDGNPTYVNQRILDYIGARFEDFRGRGWEAFLHPDDRPETANAFRQAIQTGTSHTIVHRLRRSDGAYRWHHTRAEPLRDQQGTVIQWYGLSVDVDEGKRAEDLLRRSEALLAEAQRLSHSGASAYNESTVLYWSEGAYRIWGFDPAQGIPDREAVFQRVHPDDRDRMRADIDRVLVDPTGSSNEFRIVLPDGTVRHLESIRKPVFSASGEFVEVVSTQLDVTERKRAEQALRESEYKLRRIIETVPGLLWSAGPDGELTHINQRILDYSGMRLEDFKHGGWEAFLHPDDLPETAMAFHHAIQTGISYEAVHRLRRLDGEYRWHHVRGEPLRDREGRIVQWYGLSVDIEERKQAEDLLRRSEAHLAEAQRLSHTGASAFNDSRILYWSEEMYRIWGFDPAQGLPSREAAFQRVHPDDRDRMRAEVERVLHEKKGSLSEFRIVLPDGTVKHLESIREPVFTASGELVEIVGTQIDVTERKRAEQALRQSETKFRDYAETASDWFWEIGPDYKFTMLTENAFGSDAGYRIGTACWDGALDLETEPEKWRLIQAALDAREPFRDFVYCAVAGNGSRMHVRASGKAVFDANGEFRGYRGTGTDVTEIMRAQEALRESEQRSRSAIDGIAGLVSILAPNGEFETANRQVFEYFGRSPEWVKNWGTNDAVHPEDLPRVVEFFKRAIASGIPFNHELRLRRFDGEYRWFDNRAVPVRDDTGRIARWYVLLTDIEDRIRALARLDQMQSDFTHMNRVSMMGELAASLSHEITQPIAAARNYARDALNFLDREPPDLDEVKKQLGRVVGAADRSGEIIDRIRDHIKKAPPRKCRFDLNKAIDEMIGLARSAITTNGVSVRTRLTEALSVEGDRVQLQQVVLNLILNAVEAMSTVKAGPRELLISTEQTQAGGVLVSVCDSGPGVDEGHLDRVFQAFYTTKSNGVGMGLSICRSIIDAHGGRLWADVNVPRGAVFQFTLPAKEKELMNSLPPARQTGAAEENSV